MGGDPVVDDMPPVTDGVKCTFFPFPLLPLPELLPLPRLRFSFSFPLLLSFPVNGESGTSENLASTALNGLPDPAPGPVPGVAAVLQPPGVTSP